MVETLDDLLAYTKAGGDPVLGIAEYLQQNTDRGWDEAFQEAHDHADRFEKVRRDRADWIVSVAERLMTSGTLPYVDAVSEAERLYRLEFKIDFKP